MLNIDTEAGQSQKQAVDAIADSLMPHATGVPTSNETAERVACENRISTILRSEQSGGAKLAQISSLKQPPAISHELFLGLIAQARKTLNIEALASRAKGLVKGAFDGSAKFFTLAPAVLGPPIAVSITEASADPFSSQLPHNSQNILTRHQIIVPKGSNLPESTLVNQYILAYLGAYQPKTDQRGVTQFILPDELGVTEAYLVQFQQDVIEHFFEQARGVTPPFITEIKNRGLV